MRKSRVKHHFFAKKLGGFGIFAYLCHRKTKQSCTAPRAVKDARVMTQGIFYAHTSEVCQRPHYTNSGGHPVDISPRTKSIMFRDREGCRFLCLWGSEGIDPRLVRRDGLRVRSLRTASPNPTDWKFSLIERNAHP